MALLRSLTALLLTSAIHQAWSQTTTDLSDPNAAACTPAVNLMSSCVRRAVGYVTASPEDQASCVCYVAGVWNPAVFDNAYTACLAYYSTQAPSVYAQLTSDLGTSTFCGGMLGVTQKPPPATAAPVVAATRAVGLTTAAGAQATAAAPAPPPAGSYDIGGGSSQPQQNNPPTVVYPSGGTAGNVQAQGGSPAASSPAAAAAASGSSSSASAAAPAVSSAAAASAGNSSVTTPKPIAPSSVFTTSSRTGSASRSASASIATASTAGAADPARVGAIGVGLGSFLTFLMALAAL